ncbi:rap guanine nucleotide exchange factor 1b isoform X3 [Denticeps clupeoides]|uniref:rap guanine nucleotide exchange factor 1b isoform X3 n=1 Tax=Denticeps clupeoides TaxID=299321 RepID=UPI0010A2DEF7|nr:rap guanine nucleotide exchange factor 1-like isoform X3 [Denticeps clupeoides]
MSGKIDNRQDGQRSHITFFTAKLKDRFHSPKVMRMPSKKSRLPPPELQSNPNPQKPARKKLSRLEEQEKDVVSALRYFKTIVDKMAVDTKVLQMLPGSASKVLESILPLANIDARTQHSSALLSCHNRVYQSLANLIRWADDVMVDGVDLNDKETVVTVTTVIKAVLDGVKELVKLMIEKQEHPACSKPHQTVVKVEKDTLSRSTPSKSLTDLSEEVAPPKPPLPELQLAEIRTRMQLATRQQGVALMENMPALPPKKCLSVSSPTRIAVVAPMSRTSSGSSLSSNARNMDGKVNPLQRRFSAGSQSYSEDASRLSPGAIKLSRSDEQLSEVERDSGRCSQNTSCETLDGLDPDYEFLHQDLSVSESLPFPVSGGNLSTLPESQSECSSPGPQGRPLPPRYSAPAPFCGPPALPLKKRCSVPALSANPRQSFDSPSQEDEEEEGEEEEEEQDLTPPFPVTLPPSPMPQLNGDEMPTQDSDSPPPLPEKKGRVQQYMECVGDYSEPQPYVLYPPPQCESVYQRVRHLQEVCGLEEAPTTHRHRPPALPPKQRQMASHFSSSSPLSLHLHPLTGLAQRVCPVLTSSLSLSNSFIGHASVATPMSESVFDEAGEGEYVNLETPVTSDDECMTRLSNNRNTLNGQCSVDSEDVDELSLIDHKDIVRRLTLKQENDEGPDLKAGSVDILLVHATETDRKDLVLYCEAFLTTYRTFISPEDLIKKLHYRYTQFCHSPDTFKKRVSKNTFFVLVRVVDELCLAELTESILKQLMELVFQLVCYGELSLARVLRSNILDKMEQRRLQRFAQAHAPLASRGVSARPGTLHDFRSHEVADQLTLLDAELFYKIEIPEVLLWAKEQNEEKSPNLTEFTEHFNNMSYWVRSIIIQQEKSQDREKLLLKFIKILKHLRKLNNFNSYLAVLSALDSAPIRRLEWQKQTSEGLEEYCTLIDSSSSFRAYRAALSEVEPSVPCIPYLGLILQDLTFVHLGNPDMVDGKVNFSKRWQQFNILDSMRRFQQVHYELKRNDEIISFFNDFGDHLAEEALWELSLKIKPRNRKVREEKT